MVSPRAASSGGLRLSQAGIEKVLDKRWPVHGRRIPLLRFTANSQSGIASHHNCDMNTFGDRVREARRDAKLTQPQLGRMAGLSQTTISDTERGRNSGSSEVTALARALRVSPDWLADGRGPRVSRTSPRGRGGRCW